MARSDDTRVYVNAELGVRFEIDRSFADVPPVEMSPDLPGNVTAARLTAHDSDGRQAVLAISRVEAGYETSPQELAEQLVIHNRYAAHTAEQHGWTIHSPWKATMLGGYPAMHCDYVVPERAPGGEPASPGHVQAWVAYAGRYTFQVTLGVNPPGDLAGNRATVDTVVRTFEITAPAGEGAGGGETVRRAPD
jgi:hypothetical protein